MLPTIGTYSLLIIGLIVAAGGIMGYVKAKSEASLKAGLGSGIALIVCFGIALGNNAFNGMLLGAIVAAVLCVVFAIRLKKTGKFMPSGMLLTLCALEVILLAAALLVK